MAIKLPNKNDIRCANLMKSLKGSLSAFSQKIKIDQIDQNFFEEIVIPIAVYLNSLEKQKQPGVCMLRQILKANNFKMIPKIYNLGYNKTNGKKLVKRTYYINKII